LEWVRISHKLAVKFDTGNSAMSRHQENPPKNSNVKSKIAFAIRRLILSYKRTLASFGD
jgi:hypothetical protein